VEYLKRAERYAEVRGDENYFKHYYTLYRTHYSVEQSVWSTLAWLYDDSVAELLKNG
jgi:hypothetical protein